MDEPESKRARPDRHLRLQSRESAFSNSPPQTWMTLRTDRLFLTPHRCAKPRELKRNESCLSIVKAPLHDCSGPRQCQHWHGRLIATFTLIMLAAALAFSALPRLARAEGTPRGKEVFEKRCGGCHSLDHDREGPRLRGVYGQPAGSVTSFQYSDSTKKGQITWDAECSEKRFTGPDH